MRSAAAICTVAVIVVLSAAVRQDGSGTDTTTSVPTEPSVTTTTTAPGAGEPGAEATTTSTSTVATSTTSTSTVATTSTTTTTTSTTLAPPQIDEGTPGDGGNTGGDNNRTDSDVGDTIVTQPTPGGSIRVEGRPASVRNSTIPIGSIVLAVVVILVMAAAAWITVRRRLESPRAAVSTEASTEPSAEPTQIIELDSAVDRVRLLNLLLSVGEALLDSGTAVPQVDSTLKAIAARFGVANLSAIVLPNSLILSVPHAHDVQTGTGVSGSKTLRLDQIDDVTRLVRQLLLGRVSVSEAHAALIDIRESQGSADLRATLTGHILSAGAIAMLLGGTWREVLIGGVLGAVVGWVLIANRGADNVAYVVLQPLIVASLSSLLVFASTRVINDLITFPLLVAPLVTFLPGSKLTMGVLELVTGHMISGSARLLYGAMQLVLLAMGLAAGAQLIGAGVGVRTELASGTVAAFAPWVAVAMFGFGIMLMNGVYRSSRRWILVVLYVAYAGQVIGALFFGPSLSAFFGALAMTPVAILASRQPNGPSPLVTFMPAFWILVPGTLGLRGVSLLLQDDGGGVDTLVAVLTSMVGISLGILVGLALVSDSRSGWWIGDVNDSESPIDAAE